MYGTVARFRLKPGAEADLMALTNELVRDIPGLIGTSVFRTDNEPGIYYMATRFTDRDAYWKNAQSPEQHERYLRMAAFFDGEPEWHDGEVVHSSNES